MSLGESILVCRPLFLGKGGRATGVGALRGPAQSPRAALVPFGLAASRSFVCFFWSYSPTCPNVLINPSDKAYLCLNRFAGDACNPLSLRLFRGFVVCFIRQLQLFSRHLQCPLSLNYPTSAILLSYFPTVAINPDNYNKKCPSRIRMRTSN